MKEEGGRDSKCHAVSLGLKHRKTTEQKGLGFRACPELGIVLKTHHSTG